MRKKKMKKFAIENLKNYHNNDFESLCFREWCICEEDVLSCLSNGVEKSKCLQYHIAS